MNRREVIKGVAAVSGLALMPLSVLPSESGVHAVSYEGFLSLWGDHSSFLSLWGDHNGSLSLWGFE